MASYFSSLQTRIGKRGAEFVDSRKWSKFWKSRWIVYADLLGFGDISASRQNTVNVILRFHKCVELSRQDANPERVFQFTDACYATFANVSRALSFAIATQHYCLAMNELRIKRHGPLRFHELLVPRITIARGDALTVDPGAAIPDDSAGLIRREHLLAGDGVVRAYGLEKLSAGPRITLWADSIEDVRSVELRGSRGAVRSAVESWLAQPSSGRKHGKPVPARVVHVPWPFLRIGSGGPDVLWADERASVESKLRTMLGVWRANFHQFIVEQGDPSVMKHYAGALQQVEFCLRTMNGIRTRSPMDPTQLQALLSKGARR